MRRVLALIGKARTQHARDVIERPLHIVLVVPATFTREQRVPGVVIVIVPLRAIAPLRWLFERVEQACGVVVVLEHEMQLAPGLRRQLPDRAAEIAQERWLAALRNRMHGIETKPVEVVVREPMQRILDRKGTHLRHAIINGESPGRVRRGEERRRVAREIVPLRAEVIVDDVKKDHETARMRGIDERLEILRPAVGAVRRIEQHAVVAPVATAGEVRDRHQLDRGQAGLGHMIEPLDRATERSSLREGADVKLEEGCVVPRAAAPIPYLPIIGAMINNLARTEDILWLEVRGGIRDFELAVNAELVVRVSAGTLYRQLVPAIRTGLHWKGPIEHQLDSLGGRCPKSKRDAPRR